MTEEIGKAIDHCVEYATDLLVETGEAYPFGAFIDTIGNVHPLEMEIDKKNVPNIGKVVEVLQKYCEEEMQAEKIRAYALCYEVSVKFDEEGENEDCICIDMKHVEEDVDLVYLWFDSSGEEMEIKGTFAVKR